jgi:hypothetical protein
MSECRLPRSSVYGGDDIPNLRLPCLELQQQASPSIPQPHLNASIAHDSDCVEPQTSQPLSRCGAAW